MQEKQLLQDPGGWRCRRSMLHAAWYPVRVYKYYVKGAERNKIINTVINEYLRLHLRLLFCHVGGVEGSVHTNE